MNEFSYIQGFQELTPKLSHLPNFVRCPIVGDVQFEPRTRFKVQFEPPDDQTPKSGEHPHKAEQALDEGVAGPCFGGCWDRHPTLSTDLIAKSSAPLRGRTDLA